MSQHRITFFTGAGISAESGIPTFRTGPNALWENHSIDEVCNIDTFPQNYALVHRFYNQRREQLAHVEPNAAHKAIAELQQQFPGRISLLTSNIDDLHERAGSPEVTHLHGFLPQIEDLNDGSLLDIGHTAFDFEAHEAGRYKPNVVFFGELAPAYGPLNECFQSLGSTDLVVVVGSSEQVIPFCLQAYLGSDGQAQIEYVDPQMPLLYQRMQGLHESPYHRHHTQTASEAFSPSSALMATLLDWLDRS